MEPAFDRFTDSGLRSPRLLSHFGGMLMPDFPKKFLAVLVAASLMMVPSPQVVHAKKAAAAAIGAVIAICALGGCKKSNATTRRSSGGGAGDQYPINREQKMLIQQSLATMGFYGGAIDGSYGRGTRNAIRSYQSSIGANPTGYLTTQQIETLLRQSPRYATLPESDQRLFEVELQNRLTPNEVAQLQAFLNSRGYNAGTVDGQFGGRTRNAIAAYKATMGLGGPPVATPRLLAHFNGIPYGAPDANNGTMLANGGVAQPVPVTPQPVPGATNNTVMVSAPQPANVQPLPGQTGGAQVAVLPTTQPTTQVAPSYAESDASPSNFDVRGVRLGLFVEDVAATLIEEFGEEALADTGDAAAFGGGDVLTFGLDVIQPAAGGGFAERMAIFFDEEYSDQGAVAIFRSYPMAASTTLQALEGALVGKYGTETRIPGQMVWVTNADARAAIAADPAQLASCGAPVLQMGAPADFVDTATWSGDLGGPMFVAASLQSFSRDCGEVMTAELVDGLLKVRLWDSSHLHMRFGGASTGESEVKL